MNFEDVLPAYREGKTITVPSPYEHSRIWRYNRELATGIIIRRESILSEEWEIEPEKCTRCDGTGKEPIAKVCHLTNCILEKRS